MPFIEIVEGVGQGNKVPVEGIVTVGRAPSNALCIPDSRASRQHAKFHMEEGQCLMQDMGSANGTFLNRNRVNPNVPHILKPGDEIVICGTRMVYREADSKPGTSGAGAQKQPASQLSMVMTGNDDQPAAVNASLDASISMIDIREEEKESTQGLMEAIKRLQAMVKVSSQLGDLASRKELLDRIMGSLFEIFPQADRAFIMLRDPATGELVPTIGRARDEKLASNEEFPISRTIIKTVTSEKCSILSSDAMQDDRFGAQQSIVDLSIRALMCVPFIYKEEILGVINVDTKSRLDTFDADDLAMLTGIAAQAAIALKNQELIADIEKETQTRAQLSRYISPDVVEGVLEGTIPLQLGAETKRGTVFFCDIVGFTAMSEKMTATEVVDKLNRYFCVTTEIVTRNKGTLHKFGGDMIMAFWNVLLPDDSAEYNAMRASIEMQAAVWSFDLDLENQNQKPIYLGIGLNTGEFAGGNIGGDRIEYTIIGDNVNLGQRIESMAGRWQVFASENTFEPVKDMCVAISLPPVMVKGKSQPIKIYSIRGVQTDSGVLKLTIPITIHDGNGEEIGNGILTSCHLAGEGAELGFSTSVPVQEGNPYVLAFDTPEIKRNFKLAGSADSVNTGTHEGTSTYTKATLRNLQAQDEVLDFLRPGACIESQRSWVEMKRK